MAVIAPPAGRPAVTPYLVVPGVLRLIEFLREALGAEESWPPQRRPDGSVVHAEVQIGDSFVMMGEPTGDCAPMPAMIYLYVADADAAYEAALRAGAASIMPPADQPYGDRNAGVKDPRGNLWWLATRRETVTPEEVARRFGAAG